MSFKIRVNASRPLKQQNYYNEMRQFCLLTLLKMYLTIFNYRNSPILDHRFLLLIIFNDTLGPTKMWKRKTTVTARFMSWFLIVQ